MPRVKVCKKMKHTICSNNQVAPNHLTIRQLNRRITRSVGNDEAVQPHLDPELERAGV